MQEKKISGSKIIFYIYYPYKISMIKIQFEVQDFL